MSTIEIRDLHFAYPGRPPVIDGLDLSVGPGRRVGILGASGAGKSTLLALLLGLLRGRGSIRIGNTSVTPRTLRQIRSEVGLVMQSPDDQLFHATVGEDVAFGPHCRGLSAAQARARAAESLEQLGMAGFEDRLCHELSFGEKRRVALAGVLAQKPSVVALDEPFANLSPDLVRELARLLGELEATVVLVTQELLPAVCCCDELAVLDGGRIRTHGPTLDIARDDELLDACGLGLGLYRDAWRRLTDR